MVTITVKTECDFCNKKIEETFTGRTPDDIDSNGFWAEGFEYFSNFDFEDKVFCSRGCYRNFLVKKGDTEKLEELDHAVARA